MKRLLVILALFLAIPSQGLELFGKGAASRSYLQDADHWILTYSYAGGFAFEIIPRVRIEARYTNRTTLQNALDITVDNSNVTLSDVQTTADIYGVGMDIDILGRRSAFRPFIYVGAGYLIVEKTYRIGATQGSPIRSEQLTLAVGAGMRLRVARSMALELEVFGYPQDLDNLGNQLNLYANAGLRLYL